MPTYTVVFTTPFGAEHQTKYDEATQEDAEDRAEAVRLRSRYYVDARVVAIDGVPVEVDGDA